MKTEREQQVLNCNENCNESCENRISVDVQKLSRGLKTTFEGVAIIFDSLGGRLDVTELNIASAASAAVSEENPDNEKSPNSSEAVSDTSSDLDKSETSAEISAEPEHIEESEEPEKFEGQVEVRVEAEQEEQAEQKANVIQDLKPEAAKSEAQSEAQQSPQPEEEKSSISHDDIVRLVAKKLKENRDINGPKIRKIVNQHGVENLAQLPKEKYEAVMAEIASL